MVTSLHSRSWCCWKDIGWTSIRMSVHLLVTVRSATNIIFLSIHWFYKRSFAYNLETIVSINDLLLIILRFFCVLITWDWKNLFYPLIADDEYTRHDNVSLLSTTEFLFFTLVLVIRFTTFQAKSSKISWNAFERGCIHLIESHLLNIQVISTAQYYSVRSVLSWIEMDDVGWNNDYIERSI